MTPIQQRLFEMLEELVEICEQHGITYYAAGGTTLGAVRHKGFIPWDDDVDLMMPRDDWKRFVEIARHGLPAGRVLACRELDENYPHVFGRYVDTTSTAVHYNQFLGGGPEGFVVDIFILDPIPNADTAYAAHREALSLYNDLANAIGYSYPMSSSRKQLQYYGRRIEEEGRRAVLDELERALERYDDGEYLVMRWAAAPRLFHKSIFGYPRWEEFEGLQISVPGRCADYLVQHYGNDWMYLPSGEGRVTHDAITFLDVDYQTFQADYLPFVDVERTRKAILRRRAYHIEHMDELREAQTIEARIYAQFARLVTFERAVAAGLDFDGSAAGPIGASLDWVFAEFYRWQGSRELEGREEYLHIHRYHDPVYIDIGDGLLRLAVLNLIERNRVGLAWRILRVRELAKGPLGPELSDARMRLDLVRLPASLLDVGCEDEALALARELVEKEPLNFPNRVFLLEQLYRKGEYDEEERLAAQGAKLYPAAGEFAKYGADRAYADVDADADEDRRIVYERYARALAHTTNGFIQEDVKAKAARDAERLGVQVAESIGASIAAAGQEVPGSVRHYDAEGVAKKTARLLEELTDVCVEEGIAYLLGPTSLRLALEYGCNEPGMPALDVLVAASDMPRLAKALEARLGADRALDSWLVNGNYRSFEIDYVDATSTYLVLDEGTNVAAHGLKVTVLPIRRVGSGMRSDVLSLLETGREINGYQFTKRITPKRAVAAASARVGMALGKGRFGRFLFESLSGEPETSDALALRLPDKGAIKVVPDLFDHCTMVAFEGKQHPAPASAEQLLCRVFGDDWGSVPFEPERGNALVSADIPYGRLLELLEADGCPPMRLFDIMHRIRMGMLPLANDLRIRNRAMLQARLSQDRKRWYDELHAQDEQIRAAVDAGDYDVLGRIFAGYEADALRYLRQGLCLCPCKEHLDLLCTVLRRKGEGESAAKLEGLLADRHCKPLGA